MLLVLWKDPLHHCLLIPSNVAPSTILWIVSEPTRELIVTVFCLSKPFHPFYCIEKLFINLRYPFSSVHVGWAQRCGNVSGGNFNRYNGRESDVHRSSSLIDTRSASLPFDFSRIQTILSCRWENNQASRWLGKCEVNPFHPTCLNPASGQCSESWQCPQGLRLHLGYCVPPEGDMCSKNAAR